MGAAGALFRRLPGEDDRVLAWLELEQDPVWTCLGAADRLRYIAHALGAGRAAAHEYSGRDPFAIAAAEKVTVRFEPGDNRVAGVPTRSEYDAGARSITLYRTALDSAHELLKHAPGPSWTGDRVAALHIAHELFHHLEATRFPPLDQQLPPVVVKVQWLGVWRTRRRLRQCREVGAHAFAKDLLCLPFFPGVLGWLRAAVPEGPQAQDPVMLLLECARKRLKEAEAAKMG